MPDTAITDIRRKFEAIQVDAMLAQIVKEFEEEIEDLVRNDQLLGKGIKSDGNKITPEYAESTKAQKRKKGQPTDHVTLRDTGKFHESFLIEIALKQGFEIQARDAKAAGLVKKYGEEILGLTEESETRVSMRFVKSRMQELFRAKFGLSA